jgi:hypothetical protein
MILIWIRNGSNWRFHKLESELEHNFFLELFELELVGTSNYFRTFDLSNFEKVKLLKVKT